MSRIPTSIEETIEQAKAATKEALSAGNKLVQVELVIPEIALQSQSLALEFTRLLESYGEGLRVIFPDTGAAMLARRNWGKTVFKISDLGSRFTSVEENISPEDTAYLVVCPSSVEIGAVEKLSQIANDKPIVLLIPQLEDVSIVGIGYAARQLRDRFIASIESAYYFRPLESGFVIRSYPGPWEVWLDKEEGYESIAQQSSKPGGEELERLILKATNPTNETVESAQPVKKRGLLGDLKRLLRALNQ
jgi:hypothetical protein